MRIACLDASAADRVALQELLDRAFQSCRDSFGHVPLVSLYPATVEQLLVNQQPACAVLGPKLSVDEKLALCRTLHDALPNLPLVTIFPREEYSLRSLRRFERSEAEIFCCDEQPVRLVHTLLSYARSGYRPSRGSLVTVFGVKGGVGATSIVTGLAHAACALGKSAVVLDLSSNGTLSHYLAASRWHSPDHASMLMEELPLDAAVLERAMTDTPSGIRLLLPPSGGVEVRELWLRSPEKFELSLSIIELLQQSADLVLVDLAGSEGILPFALLGRAQARLLISSNTPASVHLLASALDSGALAHSEGPLHILFNQLDQSGLTLDDMLDFLYADSRSAGALPGYGILPCDRRAQHWMGTGNSFYTEGSLALQRALEDTLDALINGAHTVSVSAPPRKTFLSLFHRPPPRLPVAEGGSSQKLLPFLQPATNPAAVRSTPLPRDEEEFFHSSKAGPGSSASALFESVRESTPHRVLYEPPRPTMQE